MKSNIRMKTLTVQPTATAFFASAGDSTDSIPMEPSFPPAKNTATSWFWNRYSSVSMQYESYQYPPPHELLWTLAPADRGEKLTKAFTNSSSYFSHLRTPVERDIYWDHTVWKGLHPGRWFQCQRKQFLRLMQFRDSRRNKALCTHQLGCQTRAIRVRLWCSELLKD